MPKFSQPNKMNMMTTHVVLGINNKKLDPKLNYTNTKAMMITEMREVGRQKIVHDQNNS
jgi:hypothetical protein